MQIVELKVEGYRTLKNVSWKPGNLNIVIGPNASGKSNLLKLLGLLKQSQQGDLSDEVLRSGGISSVLWNGQGDSLYVAVTLAGSKNPGADTLRYSFHIKRIGVTSSFIIDQEHLYALELVNSDEWSLGHAYLERSRTEAFYGDGVDDTDLAPSGLADDETLLSQLKHSYGKPKVIGDLQHELGSISVHQELRTDVDARLRQPVITSFEEHLNADGQNLTSVLHTHYESNLDYQENIDRAMRAAFGNEYSGLAFPPAGSQRIEFAIRWKSLKPLQPATVLSDGTLRFLFLIASLSSPTPPSLICIDEPETGLHPSMLPIIAEYAANAAQRTQVVLTTHSVQFLDAFSEYAPTTTVAQMHDGETKLVTLDGEKLAYWLKNYSLGALFNSGELENMAQDALEDEEANGEAPEPVSEDGE